MDLVAPLIPDAQKNRSPDLLLEGLRTGLQAFAQFAQIRRQTESDVAHMALQERLSKEQHELEQRKLDQAAELIPAHKALLEAQTDLATSHAEAWASGTATAAQAKIEFNKQHQALIEDVNKSAGDLRLNDVKFATENPVQFAANVLHFEDMYRFSPASEVKNAILQYRTIADQQKIPLKTGVVSEDGVVKGSGEGRQVPIWQVVKRMMDPLTQEQTMLDLEASGHTRVVTGLKEAVDMGSSLTPKHKVKALGKVSVSTTTTEPSPLIKSWLEKGKGVDFSPVPSRVPTTVLPSSASAGTTPTSYEATDTDMMLQKARAAIGRGAPRDVVAKRLEEMGISADQLDQE